MCIGDSLKNRGVNLFFVNVKAPVKDVMIRSGFLEELGKDNILPSKGYALGYLFKSIDHKYCAEVCPYVLFNECYTVKDYVKFEPAENPIKALYEGLSNYEDVEVYVGRAYGSLILKADTVELGLKSQDFYTDGTAIYIPSTKVVKRMDELVSLGSLCREKGCAMKNGFV